MKITYRIPSKKVPYGYVEIVDDQSYAIMPDPDVLAKEYAQYILAYQAAEVAAFEQSPKVVKPKAKPAPEDDINVAAQLIKDELGATELSPEEAAKPWNKTDQPTESKPWVEPPGSDWDF